MLDLVAIGAHPDDVELFAGGLIAKLCAEGRQVGIIHLTHGERSTRGTVEERLIEARESARILGVNNENLRVLDLGDGQIENTEENRVALVDALRAMRPRLVLHGYPDERHPDHRKGSDLAADASFYARLRALETAHPAHAVEARFQFFHHHVRSHQPISFLVDITAFFERKMEALRAHRSQFHNPDYPGEETYISSPEFFEQIETRARYFGGMRGVRYAEPFLVPFPPIVEDPVGLLCQD